MKNFLFLMLLISIQLHAQTSSERYIELVAEVNAIGTARVKYAHYPQEKSSKMDTLINSKKIDSIIKAKHVNKEMPLAVINELARDGWELVSTVFVPGLKQETWADKGEILYYLRKRF